MIRFRNPGTQFNTEIQVMKNLYNKLGSQAVFGLKEMSEIIAESRLMTAYGYAGQEALKLSKKSKESLDSTKMNAKMYAEVFMRLGWVTPYGEKTYPLVFTFIGAHIAEMQSDEIKLYEQCVLGINNPIEVSEKMTYYEKVRFVKCALRTFIDMGGILYKHELCIAPMSVNDVYEKEYQQMISKLKHMRGKYENLLKEFDLLCKELKMKHTSVDNCTRLPIALMSACGYIEKVTDNKIYNHSLSCLKITEYGIKVYNEISKMKDLRLDEYNTYDEKTKEALIRIGIFTMLSKAGFNISKFAKQLEADKKMCKSILNGRELLFSPCQTIKRGIIERAIGEKFGADGIKDKTKEESVVSSDIVRNEYKKVIIDKRFLKKHDFKQTKADTNFYNKVTKYIKDGLTTKDVTKKLFDDYVKSTQKEFYPLIATLFKIMGFNCDYSRAGDNGSRWDAIIIDERRSIPIEIKSPTEEKNISIKAVRQALENKIVLLSRKTFATDREVTTLAIGYNMPNERAEVSSLIEYFKITYGIKVAIIDLKSLLYFAVSIIKDNKIFDTEKIFTMEGLVSADIK